MVSRYVPNFTLGISPGNPNGHPPSHVAPMPLGVAMATAAAAAAISTVTQPPQSQTPQSVSQQPTQGNVGIAGAQQQPQIPNQGHTPQTLKGPPLPPNSQTLGDFHIPQCLMSTGPTPGASPSQHPHYRIIHSRTDGYVAASSAGFSAPQSGPPHQGPPVIRGLQSGPPPTQQQDLSKMQQPPQSMYVPTGGGSAAGGVRPSQQANLYRGTSTAAPRAPRHNLTMTPPQTMYQPQIQQMVMSPFFASHPTPRQATSQMFHGPPYFPQNQLPAINPPSYQFFYPNSYIPQPRSNAVPGGIVQPGTLTAGPSASQAQLIPGAVITAAGAGAQPTGQTTINTGTTQRRRRKHAIDIIHPDTHQNILDELEVSKNQNTTPNQEVDYQDPINLQPGNDILGNGTGSVQQVIDSGINSDPPYNKTLQGIAFVDMMHHHKISVGPQPSVSQVNEMIGPTTPIVSAMSDGPSVEIHPKQQTKKKSRAIEPIPPPSTQSSVDKSTIDNSKTSSTVDSSGHSKNESVSFDKNSQQNAALNTIVPLVNKNSEDSISVNKAINNKSNCENKVGITSNNQQNLIPSTSVVSITTSATSTVTVATTTTKTYSEPKSITSSVNISNNNTNPNISNITASNTITTTTTGITSKNLNSQQISSTTSISSNSNQQSKRETKSFQQQKSTQQQTALPSSANNNSVNYVVSGNVATSTNNNSNNNTSNIGQSTKTFGTSSYSNILSKATSTSSNLQSTVVSATTISTSGQLTSSKQQNQNPSELNSSDVITALSTSSSNMVKPHKGKDKHQHNQQQQMTSNINNNINDNDNSNNNNNSNSSSGIESSSLLLSGGSSTIPPDKHSTNNNFHKTNTNTEKGMPSNNNKQKLTNDRNKETPSNLGHPYTRSDKNENVISEDSNLQVTSNKKTVATQNTSLDSNIENLTIKNQSLDETDRVENVITSCQQIAGDNYSNNNEKSYSSTIDNTSSNITNNNIKSSSKSMPQNENDSSNSNKVQQKLIASKDHIKSNTTDNANTNSTLKACEPSVETKTSLSDNNNSVVGSSNLTITNGAPTSSSLLPSDNTEQTENTSSLPVISSLISYNEGQWSPTNRSGIKVYDRSQLLNLRESPHSKAKPNVNPEIANVVLQNIRIPQPSALMPSFANRNNNRRGQSMGGSSSNLPLGGAGMTSLVSGSVYLKQASLSGVNAKNSSKGSRSDIIHMSLSLREDVKLSETENAWRPTHLKQSEDIPPEERAKEEIFRKVRGILNKLTPEKFDTLVDQIMKLQIDTKDKVLGVMTLVFEKAIDEPNFSTSYAKLCQRLGDNKVQSEIKAAKDGGKLSAAEKASNLAAFKNALLDKTEHEFRDNVSDCQAKQRKLQPLVEQINSCNEPEKKIELQLILEEEERKIRRRSGGTVRFIGELFKISMLTGNIIKNCIDGLLDPTSEDKLECLCKLLTTVGKKFESTPISNKDPRLYSLEEVIVKMKAIADRKADSKVSSRVRFMLQDVIDLRKNKWISTKTDANPKTMDQIQKEVKTEQMNNQYINYNLMSNKKDDRRYSGMGSSGNTGNNMPFGSGNSGGNTSTGINYYKSNRSQQAGDEMWLTQTSKGSRAVDTNKLGQMFNTDIELGGKLGGMSNFQWNNVTPTAVTSNSFAPLSTLEGSKSSSTGPRNKGSFNKGSTERDKYEGIHSRSGLSHGSRENSSSRHSSLKGSERDKENGRGSMSKGGGGSGTVTPSHHSSFGSSSSSSVPLRSNNKPPVTTTVSHEFINCSSINESELEQNVKVSEEIQSSITEIISIAMDDSIEATIPIFNEFANKHRWYIVFKLLEYYIQKKLQVMHRKTAAKVVLFLMSKNYLSLVHFRYAYMKFSGTVDDLILDVPELWKYTFQFVGPLVYNKAISIKELWNSKLSEFEMGPKFLKEMILYFTKECGPNYTRELFRNNFSWTDFLKQGTIDKFIEENNFEFIKSSDSIFVGIENSDYVYIKERLRELLSSGSADSDDIIDYLNGNIVTVNNTFLRELTEILCESAITNTNKSYKLDKNKFQQVCVPLLQRYVDTNEERELECLYTLQSFVHELEHPSGLLNDIFAELYETDTIPADSFIKWRDSTKEPNGKGVAVKALNPFFTNILSGETSEENN